MKYWARKTTSAYNNAQYMTSSKLDVSGITTSTRSCTRLTLPTARMSMQSVFYKYTDQDTLIMAVDIDDLITMTRSSKQTILHFKDSLCTSKTWENTFAPGH